MFVWMALMTRGRPVGVFMVPCAKGTSRRAGSGFVEHEFGSERHRLCCAAGFRRREGYGPRRSFRGSSESGGGVSAFNAPDTPVNVTVTPVEVPVDLTPEPIPGPVPAIVWKVTKLPATPAIMPKDDDEDYSYYDSEPEPVSKWSNKSNSTNDLDSGADLDDLDDDLDDDGSDDFGDLDDDDSDGFGDDGELEGLSQLDDEEEIEVEGLLVTRKVDLNAAKFSHDDNLADTYEDDSTENGN